MKMYKKSVFNQIPSKHAITLKAPSSISEQNFLKIDFFYQQWTQKTIFDP